MSVQQRTFLNPQKLVLQSKNKRKTHVFEKRINGILHQNIEFLRIKFGLTVVKFQAKHRSKYLQDFLTAILKKNRKDTNLEIKLENNEPIPKNIKNFSPNEIFINILEGRI